MEQILIILLGWPSGLLGIALLVSGVVLRSTKFGMAGAIVATGFCLFSSAYPPPFRWLGLAALTGNWVCYYAIKRNWLTWSAVFILPISILAIWLAHAVLSQK